MKRLKYLILAISGIFLFSGCGAESELEDMGIAYTQENYFKHGVYKKDIPILELFYDAGMPVETTDKDGDTALDNAIYKGHLELIKFLIEEHDAKIKNESLTHYIEKNFGRDITHGEKVLQYLFDEGAKLTDNGGRALGRYYTNNRSMDVEFMMVVAKNGLSADASTQRLVKIYENFATYAAYHLLNTQTTITEINTAAEKLIPLIEQLIKNGGDIKKAYSKFDILFNRTSDKSDWIKTLVQVAVEKGKIDINKDFVKYSRPILVQTVYGVKKIEDIKETVQYLFELGADPLVKIKDSHYRYGNGNAISMFCRHSEGINVDTRPSNFYPEICKTENAELFKLLFTDFNKYEQEMSKLSNLIKARNLDKQKQYDEAFKLYLPYAENNNYEAQEKIADYYNAGRGVEKDYKKAIQWYQKATEHKKADYWVYRQLALAYVDPKDSGVKKDLDKAEELMTKANLLAKDWSKSAQEDTKKLLKRIETLKNR